MGETPPLQPALSQQSWLAAVLRAAADALIAVLLAPTCASCDKPLDAPTRGPVCDRCWASIVLITQPVCDRCGEPVMRGSGATTKRSACVTAPGVVPPADDAWCARCRGKRHVLTRNRAVGEYDGTLRAIVHALKYDGRRQVAGPLGRLMKVRGSDILADVDIVVPVPLHRSRQRARGFNQAADLARELGLPIVDALKRIRATRSQTELPEPERHANVRDAFAIARRPRARFRSTVRLKPDPGDTPSVRPKPDTTGDVTDGADAIAGRTVVLVDDVSTTGATLEACARVLLAAGAREVRALTAARVVTRRP